MTPRLIRPALLLIGLLAAVGALGGQTPPAEEAPIAPTRERTFRIPFQTPPGERRLREVQLLYSTDQGRSWRPYASAVPEQGSFQQFTAPQDGSYWFAVRTVDLQGHVYPATDDGLRPGLKVVVDTQPPTVILRPLPPREGAVGVEWEVRDDNLDLASLRLEYRTIGGGSWQPLRIDPSAVGQQYWPPMTNANLEVRLTVYDTAKNLGEAKVPITPGQPSADASTFKNVASPGPSAPAVRMVNSKSISLNYRLAEVGPSGAVVELWYTKDTRSWTKYREDPNPSPPFVFEVAEEGVYGLTLVVRSGVGLGDRAPQVGDTPQIWVEVDLTKPVVRLLSAEVGRGLDANNLTITWSANDKNLHRQPITLSYAEQADGPWQVIASNLDNTGRYVWRVPPSGVRFHIRVEAIDWAGNIGSAKTDKPVIVDLKVPKVSNLDVAPVSR